MPVLPVLLQLPQTADPGRALAPSGLVTDAGIDGFAAAESFKPFLVPCARTPLPAAPPSQWLGR